MTTKTKQKMPRDECEGTKEDRQRRKETVEGLAKKRTQGTKNVLAKKVTKKGSGKRSHKGGSGKQGNQGGCGSP